MKKRRGPKKGTKYADTNPHHFGKILAASRRRRGLTQEELAQQLGTSRRVVSYYEREVSNPSVETLHKIADVLKVPIERFIEHGNGYDSFPQITDRGLNRRIEQAQLLPPSARGEIKRLIDSLLKAHGIKQPTAGKHSAH